MELLSGVLPSEPPEGWPLPFSAAITGKGTAARLSIVADGIRMAPPPHAGCWRSLAETTTEDQILGVARRYGPLTGEAWEGPGEPLHLWHRLIEKLRLLAQAWNEDGELRDTTWLAKARSVAVRLHGETLAAHSARGGLFVPSGFTVNMLCLDLMTYWQRDAIADVAMTAGHRRCRHCNAWMSTRERRSDAGFCTPAHRAAFHQKRVPKSDFWAEA